MRINRSWRQTSEAIEKYGIVGLFFGLYDDQNRVTRARFCVGGCKGGGEPEKPSEGDHGERGRAQGIPRQ